MLKEKFWKISKIQELAYCEMSQFYSEHVHEHTWTFFGHVYCLTLAKKKRNVTGLRTYWRTKSLIRSLKCAMGLSIDRESYLQKWSRHVPRTKSSTSKKFQKTFYGQKKFQKKIIEREKNFRKISTNYLAQKIFYRNFPSANKIVNNFFHSE